MSSPVRITAIVTGRVQGVGFRYWTMAKARRLGLAGEAANQMDGSVQVIAEGDRQAVDSLLEWLQSRDAPGRVDNVDATFTQATGEFSGFGVD
ncbi:acylphosphatase [Arthrobacter sp. AZCC_0090]|uniref:acylphosphatase n=1 Tax=Arthrobacter sp. AZCC_0090 TaxID=2735881 RepID=UPI001612E2A8|nr:acylphosphatase [Arthrobacter sp. AZCC_0090]MBB6406169.1 acylphosphatase [Arthrobacter sp. AZCC_0090]